MYGQEPIELILRRDLTIDADSRTGVAAGAAWRALHPEGL